MGRNKDKLWRDYHDATKHSPGSLNRSQTGLDWANMPDPFRHYEGVPVLDLPADPPLCEVPALEVLSGAHGATSAGNGAAFLSQLLFNSAAISASKLVPSTGYRYALRVNPSSGNLHPTEFHFLTRGLKDWPDGLYHYRPSSHMAEQRALGPFETKLDGSSDPVTFVLTSIAWREAWKYGDRAYRYCLLDVGHAWQSLALAARAIGCESDAIGHFPDDGLAELCRLDANGLPTDEWPMLIVNLRGQSIPRGESNGRGFVSLGGRANQLSSETVEFPRITSIHEATKVLNSACLSDDHVPARTGGIKLPAPAPSARSFGETARMRRSALDFEGGTRSISLEQLSAILHAVAQPFSADLADTRLVQLYLFIHRVDNLPPGVYKCWPQSATLERIKLGDVRVMAAGLSLGQQLAGNACVAFSMVGDLDRAVELHGDRGYRYVHFEAGAIGQRLYLAAGALGLGATGIGAFYDEEVHRHLNLEPGQGQVVYHFAIGYPVPDGRILSRKCAAATCMIGLLVHGDNHFITRGPLPDRSTALALVRRWSLIQIGAATPPELESWRISSQEFREDLEWAVVVGGDSTQSPAIVQLLAELAARGIAVHDAGVGSW